MFYLICPKPTKHTGKTVPRTTETLRKKKDWTTKANLPQLSNVHPNPTTADIWLWSETSPCWRQKVAWNSKNTDIISYQSPQRQLTSFLKHGKKRDVFAYGFSKSSKFGKFEPTNRDVRILPNCSFKQSGFQVRTLTVTDRTVEAILTFEASRSNQQNFEPTIHRYCSKDYFVWKLPTIH